MGAQVEHYRNGKARCSSRHSNALPASPMEEAMQHR
jgi:hypothetical protein